MARIKRRTTRAELGAIVCEALSMLDDSPVLVGGAAVSIYSDGRYVAPRQPGNLQRGVVPVNETGRTHRARSDDLMGCGRIMKMIDQSKTDSRAKVGPLHPAG